MKLLTTLKKNFKWFSRKHLSVVERAITVDGLDKSNFIKKKFLKDFTNFSRL